MRRPVAVLVPTLALLLLLGTPFLHVTFNAPDARILPENAPSRAAFDRLAEQFGPGPFAPIVLAIRTTGSATDAANLASLYEYSRRLAADPRIERVDSLVDVDPRLTLEQYRLLYRSTGRPPDRYIAEVLNATTRGDLTGFTILTPYGPNEAIARELVRDLRSESGGLAPPPDATVLVGGGAADVEDVVTGIGAEFPRTAVFILVSTYVVLLLLLRSLLLPLKALAMNSLSILASFGALVWIFQDGNLSMLFGTRPLGFVETTQPVILFCVLFGLSMDYEVFLLTRMRESWEATHDNPTAVAHGLERSGRIVTSAALIVIVVAGSFAFADIVLIKALGVGIAIAVALDATIVRALRPCASSVAGTGGCPASSSGGSRRSRKRRARRDRGGPTWREPAQRGTGAPRHGPMARPRVRRRGLRRRADSRQRAARIPVPGHRQPRAVTARRSHPDRLPA
jgi:RND superfamily putative drug exporter